MVKTITKTGPGMKGLQNIQEIGNDLVTKVGFFETARYEKKGTPVAAIAAQNEFGNPDLNIPARPFMRPTMDKRRGAIAAYARTVIQQLAKAQIPSAYLAMDSVGGKIAGEIKRTITQVHEPVLAPATILARKYFMAPSNRPKKGVAGISIKPLIRPRSGIMLNSVTHVTERKK